MLFADFVVPTIALRLLFVFAILSHDRTRPVHFALTSNPSLESTVQQLLETFPWDSVPRHLLRDRDRIYRGKFYEAANGLGIREVLTGPQSP
jgi:hypothetical protein